MRWNSGAGECQLYLDADCSSVTYTSAPSAAVLAAARDLAGRPAAATAVLDRTESYQETLATSLLSRVDANTVTEAELTEAFCRDVDSLSFEFERQEAARLPRPRVPPRPASLPRASGKPAQCAHVPRTVCAVAYDSGDCDGGWLLPIPEGEQRFKFFSSYYTYRNDIDVVGVRSGCVLTAFEDSSFNGDQVTVRASGGDRWVLLLLFPSTSSSTIIPSSPPPCPPHPQVGGAGLHPWVRAHARADRVREVRLFQLGRAIPPWRGRAEVCRPGHRGLLRDRHNSPCQY